MWITCGDVGGDELTVDSVAVEAGLAHTAVFQGGAVKATGGIRGADERGVRALSVRGDRRYK